MKLILFCLLFICVSSTALAQQLDSLRLTESSIELQSIENDSIVNEIAYESIIPTKINDSIIVRKLQDSIILQNRRARLDSLTAIVMVENWDTITYNPYPTQFRKDPFLIDFIDSTYASPIDRKKVITSRYGWRRNRPHKGIDIDLVTGDNVMTILDGVVRFASYSKGHGKTVVVRHYNGLETVYTHLSSYSVKANEAVTKGQIIGQGGASGNARGSHLHLVVSYRGNHINPEYLFDFGEDNLIRNQSVWITKEWTSTHFHSSKKQSDLVYYNSYDEALESHETQDEPQVHIIKSGDTLSRISNKYNVPLATLYKKNAITKNTILKIGKKIIVR